MSKKVKWKNLPSTFRTCIIGMAICLVVGIGLTAFGALFSPVKRADLKTVTATITAIDKVRQGTSDGETMEELREDAGSEAELKYEFKVTYGFTAEGKEQTVSIRKPYADGEELNVGDTEEFKYAVVNGKILVNPDTGSTYMICGVLFILAGAAAAVAAFILRPQNRRKHQ